MTTTAAAAGIRRHTGTYPAEPGQVRLRLRHSASRHGFNVIAALAGAGNWASTGSQMR